MNRILLFFLLTVGTVSAQQTRTDDGKQSWQQVWQETMDIADDEEQATAEEDYVLLNELSEQPIDLNSATREELERLPFLSAQQVMDLIEYRDHYGPVRSMGELRAVRSLDYRQVMLLPYFIYIGEQKEEQYFPELSKILSNGKQEITTAVRMPFYDRKGDTNGYLGYKYRHWLRYQFHYGDYVKLGVVGAQDAGEPFFSNQNKWGYDAYSYYLQIRKLGRVDNAVVGKYKLSAGMGLVLNNSFSLGKMTVLQNSGRSQNVIRAHASRSQADYFQGAAATLSLAKKLKLTAFASYRTLDATLNDDGTVKTIVTSGYHRTPTEMEKKNNTTQMAVGGRLAYKTGGFHVGATSVYTQLDRRLSPDTKSNYRRYYAQGRRFLNGSVDYGYMHHRWMLNGETAIGQNGAVATLNALGYQSHDGWSVTAVQRFYSYRYTSLFGHAFSEGGRVQNESGFYLGATWRPLARLQLQGYADYAYFPWARYRVSQASSAQDYLGEAIYTLNRHWTLKGRYRLHLRQLDNEAKTALQRHNEHRARIVVGFSNGGWTAAAQADGVRAVNEQIDQGYMVSGNVGWKQDWWQVGTAIAYFNTDSYDSRIYAYERQLPHEFSFPVYFGCGYRALLVGRAKIGASLQIDAKCGYTHYNDRSVIGSGLQEIAGSSMTDLDVQVRWLF